MDNVQCIIYNVQCIMHALKGQQHIALSLHLTKPARQLYILHYKL